MKFTKDLCEKLREIFSYDESTGLLTRKQGKWAGFVQRSKDAKGYVMTYADGKSYRAHRVVWAMHYNEPPPEMIDHINGIKDDNRICNLRAATPSQNTTNKHAKPSKKSGLPKGVQKTRSRYMAAVYVDGKRIYAGKTFATPEDAALAYNQLAIAHHKEFAQVNQIGK
jgi:hypothetical protein